MMKVRVRLSAGLAQETGNSRLVVTLTDGASVFDLLDYLQATYPTIDSKLGTAVATVSGRYVSASTRLTDGQEVALLLPVAGGSN